MFLDRNYKIKLNLAAHICATKLIPKFKMFVAILTDFKIKFTVLSKLVAFVFRPEPVIDFLYHNTPIYQHHLD